MAKKIETLAEYMKRRGLRQYEIADAIGASRPLVCQWLSGARKPGLAFAIALERFTKGRVPVEVWVDGAGS